MFTTLFPTLALGRCARRLAADVREGARSREYVAREEEKRVRSRNEDGGGDGDEDERFNHPKASQRSSSIQGWYQV